VDTGKIAITYNEAEKIGFSDDDGPSKLAIFPGRLKAIRKKKCLKTPRKCR
jgi:hypothetical protein